MSNSLLIGQKVIFIPAEKDGIKDLNYMSSRQEGTIIDTHCDKKSTHHEICCWLVLIFSKQFGFVERTISQIQLKSEKFPLSSP